MQDGISGERFQDHWSSGLPNQSLKPPGLYAQAHRIDQWNII